MSILSHHLLLCRVVTYYIAFFTLQCFNLTVFFTLHVLHKMKSRALQTIVESKCRKGKTPTQIHTEIGEDHLSLRTVKR